MEMGRVKAVHVYELLFGCQPTTKSLAKGQERVELGVSGFYSFRVCPYMCGRMGHNSVRGAFRVSQTTPLRVVSNWNKRAGGTDAAHNGVFRFVLFSFSTGYGLQCV